MTHVSNEMMMDVQGWRIYIPKEGMWINDDERAVRPLWDCIHDLNLVHEIEAGLTGDERKAYVAGLYMRATKGKDISIMRDRYWYCVNADAQQKCDALFPILQERSKG